MYQQDVKNVTTAGSCFSKFQKRVTFCIGYHFVKMLLVLYIGLMMATVRMYI